MSEPVPLLAFDDVVIDLAGHRLLRAGVEQPLEPKAFGVLATLAVAPGRVFSRDQILDAVWGHRHVTPGVLNRVMTLLRHALGEDAHAPRYLHTVHGVGYRFDLPSNTATPEAVQEPLADDTPEVPAAATVAPAAHELPRRRVTDAAAATRRWPWLLAAAALLLALVGIQAWRRDAPAPAPASSALVLAAKPPTLVVMPLKPIGDGAGVRTIADGLSEELIGSLARIDGLRVIARESTNLAAAESTEPAVLAKRLGISHALEGSLQQAGQSLRIRLRLIDAKTGSMLWVRDFDRDASEVLALQRDIAQAVATSLTLKLGLNLVPKKSGDAEFLRRYLAAQTMLRERRGRVDETVEPAEAEFRALLRERPDDARIHAALAMALDVRAYRRPLQAAALRVESLVEAAIAQRLDPELPEPYYIQAGEACRANVWERCLVLLSETETRSKDVNNARTLQVFALAQLGYLDRAIAIAEEDVARDPISPGKRFIFGRLLDTQGRHEEALRQFQRSDAFAIYGHWFNAVWRGDLASATRIAEHEMGAAAMRVREVDRLQPSYIATSRALVDPAYWPQAELEMRKFETETGLLNFNRVLMPDAPKHAAELIQRLDVLRERSYSSWDLLLWTKDLAYLRRDPAFQGYLRDNGILAYWRKHGFPKQCRPHGDGAHCE